MISGGSDPVDRGVDRDDDLRTVFSSNEEAFAAILRLYARPGHVIVDPTFGHGRFWTRVNRSLYDARCTDLTEGVDLRALPYADGSVDLEVIDPPYRYTPARHRPQDEVPGHGAVDSLYNLRRTALRNTEEVIVLYEAGFREARRILKRGGFLVVKCQDTVQDGVNVWVHDELRVRAEALDFAMRDLAIVAPPSVLASRWKRQRHLRKAHSYFLVFRRDGAFPFGLPPMERRDGRTAP